MIATNPLLDTALARVSPDGNGSTKPMIPDDAPFTPSQRQWLDGLLTGLATMANAAAMATTPGSAEAEAPATPLLIAYGSQSGNAEALSKDVRKHATAQGFGPEVTELNALEPADLAGHAHVLMLCSTFGEGDPPDNAMKFFEKLETADADLSNCHYSVLGLGDSSYPDFNSAAIKLDAELERLGAQRVADMVPCDVAYEDDFDAWKNDVFASEAFANAAGGAAAPAAGTEPEVKELYNKNNPFGATLLEVRNLNEEGSAKEVNHVEIDLAGAGVDLDYAVGDALGVWPINCTESVQEVLAAAGFTGRETVTLKSGPTSLRAALLKQLDICVITAKTLETLNLEAETKDVEGMQLVDIIETYKPAIEPQQLAEALRPLQPRLYSIASSPKAHPGEVHLTVGAVRYQTHGKARKGVASTFLADRCGCGTNVGVYLQRSAHFHLPAPEAPLIMVGPGTGIAPFRAFLEERAVTEAPGKNWLFFGDQHEATDFLYRDELAELQDKGVLSKLSLAWSRDGDQKVYVQDKMREAGAEFYQWLEDGGCFYVCGDASRMAVDVDKALRQVIAEHGGHDEAGVEAYMQRLGDEHRYQRDVY
ncbi:MAG: sulfite reductase subunit alpha [Planctomycetota bacterium]